MASALVTPLGGALGKPVHANIGLHAGWRLQNFVPCRPLTPPTPTPRGGTSDPEAAAVAAAPPAPTTTAAPGAWPRRSVRAKGCCGGGGAATAAALPASSSSSSAAVLGVSAGALFSGSSALMVPVYGLMAFFPSAKLTRDLLLNSSALYISLALAYAATLAGAWQAGLGAALAGVAASLQSAAVAGAAWAAVDLSPLAAMFTQPLVTLLSWLHLLVLDALMAREVALDGLRTGTPTGHSVLLCFFFGPTGLLSHAVTRLLLRRRGSPTSG